MISLADNGDEQVALIGGTPHFDYEDPTSPCLVISVYTSEAVASDQRLSGEDMYYLLVSAQPTDLKALRGYPVWVKRDGPRMEYLRPWSRKP